MHDVDVVEQTVEVGAQDTTPTVLVVEAPASVAVRVVDLQVVEADRREVVVVNDAPDGAHVVAVGMGPPGPPGPQGESGEGGGSGEVVSKAYTAGATVNGHRAVVFDDEHRVVHAEPGTLYNAGRVVGITTGSAVEDAAVTVHSYGELTEPSWSWTVHGDVFLGAGGVLTQSVPTSGAVLRLGYATAATSMFVDIDDPIYL